jgi:hypothetical protein
MISTDQSKHRTPWITALIIGSAVAAHLTGVDTMFEYQSARHFLAPSARSFTCHFAHYSASHLAWSLGAFGLLGTICELRDRCRFCLCLIASAVAIPMALNVFQPSLHHYRGISGIDSALFFLLAVGIMHAEAHTRPALAHIAAVLIVAFFAKMLFEQFTHSTVFADSTGGAFVPAPVAHIAGALIGAALAPRDGGYNRSRYRASVSL